jgi:transglutaminase-like putative cysteine protease
MIMRLGETQKFDCTNLTEDTLKQLIKIAREQKTEPIVRQTIENLLSNTQEKNWIAEIETLTNFVKKSIRYTRDIEGVEYVKTPLRHLHNLMDSGLSYGDCDDMSLLLATLLGSAGYKARFVIVRTPGNPYPSYNHIYVEAFEPKSKKWVALDATMKDRSFDWQPTALMRKEYSI